MNEDKSTRYHRLSRRADVTGVVVHASVLVALISTGASHALAALATVLAEASAWTPPLASSLAFGGYVAALIVILDIAALPVAFFRGFWLERLYGLSAETARAWLWDHVKAGAIRILFAMTGALVVYACIRRWPVWWWLAAGGAFGLFTLVLAHLAPVVLLPLFFRFRPVEQDSLRTRLGSLAEHAGTRVMGIYEWALGDKTRKANAALVGMGGTRRILLSDTLIREYSEDEIEAILAHELAHHVHHDVWKGIFSEALVIVAGLLAGDRVLRLAGPAMGLSGLDDPAGLPLLLFAGGGVGLAVAPILKAVSRAHERRADRYALDLTRNPDAFVSAIRRLGAQNLAEDHPSRAVEILFYTHPPIQDRISAAKGWQPAAIAVTRN